mgnify:CR=1 FL=1
MRLGETGLKEVFKEIQRQTNKAVVYNDDQLTLSKKVKANFTDVELEEILCCKARGCRINSWTIILYW